MVPPDQRSSSRSRSGSKRSSSSRSSSSSRGNLRESGWGERYTIRTTNELEYVNMDLSQVKRLAKQGLVKATTLIWTKSTKRWHLAASIPEIHRLVRKYNPRQGSILDRLRAMNSVHSRDNANADFGGPQIRIRQPFWKRILHF